MHGRSVGVRARSRAAVVLGLLLALVSPAVPAAAVASDAAPAGQLPSDAPPVAAALTPRASQLGAAGERQPTVAAAQPDRDDTLASAAPAPADAVRPVRPAGFADLPAAAPPAPGRAAAHAPHGRAPPAHDR